VTSLATGPNRQRSALPVGRAAGESASREGIEGGRATGEADLGPLKYPTTPVGADNETMLRSFTLAVALSPRMKKAARRRPLKAFGPPGDGLVDFGP
jgi:hypothetical protein